MKKIIKYGVIFIVLILIFNFLLFISSLFPSKLIEENVKESSEILSEEGNIYQFFEYSSVTNNNYTDVLMINEAYSIDNKNPVESYMSARKNYIKGITRTIEKDIKGDLNSINNREIYDPVWELEELLKGNIEIATNYARYWHGYLPMLRTLLIFFNISEIRKVLLIIFIFLFVYLLKLIKDRIGKSIALIFGISLIIQGYFFVSYSLESSSVFIVMMVSSIILLKKIDKIRNLYTFFFIIACITNFVDYLTVPLITLAIPLMLYILYKQKVNSEIGIKKFLEIIIKSTIIWGIGYGITWLSKWIIYDVLYKEGLVSSAIEQVLFRTNIKSENINIKLAFKETLLTLLSDNIKYAIIIFVISSIILLINKKRIEIQINKDLKKYINNNIMFLIISLMPIMWYIALSNHTAIHYRFVYRHMLVFLIGILICLKNIFIIRKNYTNK